MKKKTTFALSILLAFTLLLTACTTADNATITASGTLSAVEISVAPEVAGKVVSVNVTEGQKVSTDQELFKVDDSVSKAQYDQAKAAADAAGATLTAAQTQLVYAQTQLELAKQGARAQSAQIDQSAWATSEPADYKPAWYFQKGEQIAAAQADVKDARQSLSDEQANLQQELKNASNQDFISAEKRLAQAQIAFTNAQTTLDRAKLANDSILADVAQNDLNSAQSELDSARSAYDKMLKSDAANAVLKARARVAVAQTRYDVAENALAMLQTGDESLQVSVAAAAVDQAQAVISQAEANLNQANAALALSQLQLDRTKVKAAISGTLLSRSVEVGDLLPAGGVVMTIAQLDNLNLTVYLPENQYGKIQVGQQVEIKVDSFAGKIFSGEVTWIAYEAEYTPRNVQTASSRSSTVYAVKITVPNSDGSLKPGMPADVTFTQATK